jgi:peptidoglycan hydrolase-like protein with peptidoglycan-binding domain
MTADLPDGYGTLAQPPADGSPAGGPAPSGPGEPPRPTRHRRRVRTAAVTAAAGLAAAGAGGWWLFAQAGGADPQAAPAAAGPAALAAVTRQNLVETRQVDGALGYGAEHQAASGTPGMVTWLPAEGATVSRGKPLYRIDDEPVVLLYGALPLYRNLAAAAEGPDVQVLEANLAALGYTGFTVDDSYTAETADAVRAWQADLGLAETGTVPAARVVVSPGAVRVGDATADVGARTAPGQPVLSYTGTARVVDVDLEVDDLRLARKGAKVTVVLPDGPRLRGTVASVGTVAQAAGTQPGGGTAGGGAASGAGSGGGAGSPTVEVTVTLDDPKKAGTLDQAPVDVEFVSAERKGVLTVAVAALLALREGGYGVEVVDGDGSRVVAVQVGMFASGRVEVTGAGIAAGTKVGVPPA